MRRIAYFGDPGSRRRTGGGHTFAANCLTALRPLQAELTAFSAYCPDLDDDVPEGTKKIEIRVPGLGKPSVSLGWGLKLRREVGKLPPQDLYIFDQPSAAPYFLPEVPSMMMFHGSDFVRWRDISPAHPRDALAALLWRKPVMGRLEKNYLLKRTGVPLFNSNHTLELMGRDFGVDVSPLRQYVTYMPLDVALHERDEVERRRVRQELGVTEEQVLITYLTNFYSVKRPPLAAAIARRVLGLCSEARFLFVGRNSDTKALAELAAESDRCTLVGEVPPHEARSYYSASDLAISTSSGETFGYFLAEGMAAGLPFVACSGAAIGEIISKDAGRVVDTEDDFVAALKELVQNGELRREMGRRAHASAKARFSMEAFSRKIADIANAEFGLNI